MLPPILPLSVVPVTSSQDPARQRPDIPPVTATQAGTGENAIDLKHHDTDQAALLLREEQQRQHDKRRREAQEQAEEGEVDPGGALNADGAVPSSPLADVAQRQGLWIDIEV